MLSTVIFIAAQLLWADSVWTLPDPTRPTMVNKPANAATKQDSLILQTIVSSNPPLAIINGRSLQVGDRITVYQLSAIERERVTLKHVKTGQKRLLNLYSKASLEIRQ